MNAFPALLPALSAVFGAFSAIYSPAALLLLPFIAKRRFLFHHLIIAIAVALSVWLRFDIFETSISGSGLFQIHSVVNEDHQWSYHGWWYPRGKAIPVTWHYVEHHHSDRPLANRGWWVSGIATEKKAGRYMLNTSAAEPWIAVPYQWGLAEWRYHAQQMTGNWIQKNYPNKPVAAFLTGVATGNFEDQDLRSHFSRFGLQHIMAISGFHFSLIAGFLGMMLRPFFGWFSTVKILLVLMTGYFLFLGCSPSILRAWMTTLLGFTAVLSHKSSNGINLLSVAVALLIAWDPTLILSIGFVFSCLTTASILFFYKPFDALLGRLLFQRSFASCLALCEADRWGYCLVQFIRQCLALTLAVNVVAIPVTLYYFQSFPVWSLVYNLFFPLLVAVSMGLLILALVFPPLHVLNGIWTHHMLIFTTALPENLDFTVKVDPFSPWLLTIFLILLFRYRFSGIGRAPTALDHNLCFRHDASFL